MPSGVSPPIRHKVLQIPLTRLTFDFLIGSFTDAQLRLTATRSTEIRPYRKTAPFATAKVSLHLTDRMPGLWFWVNVADDLFSVIFLVVETDLLLTCGAANSCDDANFEAVSVSPYELLAQLAIHWGILPDRFGKNWRGGRREARITLSQGTSVRPRAWSRWITL
jgi:hypothetical protein